jgi:spectinomycin phosphotransferase
VRDRPDGLREADLRLVLAEGWRIEVAALRYAAVGGGSYHWMVFPLLDGTAGRWGEPLAEPGRALLTSMLAALHESVPPAPARVAAIGLARRADLETALRHLGQPWRSGPFGEPARTLLAGAAGRVGAALRAFDQLAGAARASRFVVTHGEPHPGNVMRAGP